VKRNVFLAFGFAAALSSCGSADIDVKATLKSHQTQLEQCYERKDGAVCDAAIASVEKDMPALKSACSSGNSDACGLFPGYDQIPDLLRNYKKICVDNEVDSSIPDNLKDMARKGMQAGCDKMKVTGPKL
jgi:hypothetical protein